MPTSLLDMRVTTYFRFRAKKHQKSSSPIKPSPRQKLYSRAMIQLKLGCPYFSSKILVLKFRLNFSQKPTHVNTLFIVKDIKECPLESRFLSVTPKDVLILRQFINKDGSMKEKVIIFSSKCWKTAKTSVFSKISTLALVETNNINLSFEPSFIISRENWKVSN